MPWCEGSDSLLFATGYAQDETNCRTGHERQGIDYIPVLVDVSAWGRNRFGVIDVFGRAINRRCGGLR
jgi:hypothetical protein